MTSKWKRPSRSVAAALNPERCAKCGHEWVPRDLDEDGNIIPPTICPTCNCRHEPRTDVERIVLECQRAKCGHRWVQRTELPPVKCPRCQNPYWRGKTRTA